MTSTQGNSILGNRPEEMVTIDDFFVVKSYKRRADVINSGAAAIINKDIESSRNKL